MKKIPLTINNKTIEVLVALSDEDKATGLQNVEDLEGQGMLFVYDEPQHLDFWMKDTTIELSIIFLDENKVVLSNQHGEPESEEYISEDNAKYVLELDYTDSIKPGDQAEFSLGLNKDELDPNKLYVLNEDGSVQAEIDAESRIFSRKSTAIIIKKAKKAFESKSDVDYKDLGRYVFGELDRQDGRDPEYVESPDKSDETKMPE